jgi:hypothetical protein
MEVNWRRPIIRSPGRRGRAASVGFQGRFNVGMPSFHHDALELPDGEIVLLTRLREGQHATVLQLPASARPANAAVASEQHSRLNGELNGARDAPQRVPIAPRCSSENT